MGWSACLQGLLPVTGPTAQVFSRAWGESVPPSAHLPLSLQSVDCCIFSESQPLLSDPSGPPNSQLGSSGGQKSSFCELLQKADYLTANTLLLEDDQGCQGLTQRPREFFI